MRFHFIPSEWPSNQTSMESVERRDDTRWWDYKLVQRVQKFVIKGPQNLTMWGWVTAVQHQPVTHQDQDWPLAPQNNKARLPRIKLH